MRRLAKPKPQEFGRVLTETVQPSGDIPDDPVIPILISGVSTPETPTVEPSQGAGAALKRASEVEYQLWATWDSLQKIYVEYIASSDPDPDLIVARQKAAKEAFAMYSVASKGLLSYDSKVSEAKRTGGETVTLEKEKKDFEQFVSHIRIGLEFWLQTFSQQSLMLKTEVDVRGFADETFWRQVRNSLDNGIRNGRIPAWTALIIEDQI